MLHKKRSFTVEAVETAEELAKKLTQYTWCGCNGFRLGDVLYLNDSFSPDGAQEYGVVYAGKQIESITFGWCSEPQALELIKQMEQQVKDNSFNVYSDVENAIQSSTEHGRCHLCA